MAITVSLAIMVLVVGLNSHHRHINGLLCRAVTSSGTLSTREQCTTGGKSANGVTLVPWKRGRCLVWDATCPNTYAPPAIRESSVQAVSATPKAELNKSRKYADIIAGVDFIPFAIETSGT